MITSIAIIFFALGLFCMASGVYGFIDFGRTRDPKDAKATGILLGLALLLLLIAAGLWKIV
jgi:hypothetical protein